ncbi:hypothetical protein V9T40_012949 [Parthenolecanium corni]|uniref:Uncharacterized protein n=1 Tax=Parthenolecanium corni TaxID=536013 RepID=A0AAN9Y128_9HEMI
MLIFSVIIALFIVVKAETLEKGYQPMVPLPRSRSVKSNDADIERSPANPSQFPREKKWSLYLIPDPPYGRGPYPVPADAYQQYPYTHPRYVLERNSYPSDDFQFFYY